MGWIIRDHQGKYVLAGGTKIKGIRSSLEGEASCSLYVLQHIWLRGWRNVWFEGDNKKLVQIVNGSEDNM
ncbi:unnamed protein product [Brassica rapa subsp. trilocularis]